MGVWGFIGLETGLVWNGMDAKVWWWWWCEKEVCGGVGDFALFEGWRHMGAADGGGCGCGNGGAICVHGCGVPPYRYKVRKNVCKCALLLCDWQCVG